MNWAPPVLSSSRLYQPLWSGPGVDDIVGFYCKKKETGLDLARRVVAVGQGVAEARLETLDLQLDGVQLRLLARFLHGLAQLLAQLLLVRLERRQLLVVPARRLLLQVPVDPFAIRFEYLPSHFIVRLERHLLL